VTHPEPAPAGLKIRPAGGQTRAAVLVLYGGKARSRAPSRPWHLSAVRMTPFARALARSTAGSGTAVATLRYRVRGWNDPESAPVEDSRWALDQLRERFGPVPVVILAHSMGGRAALRVAGHPLVTGVVALAPWLPPGEPVDQLAGRRVRILHGTRDRWTDLAGSRAFTERARHAGLDVRLEELRGLGHFMLRRRRLWEGLGSHLVLDLLAERTEAPAPANNPTTSGTPAPGGASSSSPPYAGPA
jgi:pimeloyl-ACP methyl ester carboxylesterase